MAALTANRTKKMKRFSTYKMTLASGNVAYIGGMACIDLSTGKVEPGHTESDLFFIGWFDESVDATSGDKQVLVNFEREITAEWKTNDAAGTPVTAASIGSLCYILDDQTVTGSATGRSYAGRVWDVSATRGVLVEPLQAFPATLATLGGIALATDTLPAFSAGDSAPADITSGAVYQVPATAANSTITLPDASALDDGVFAVFVADGVDNGHTVQYRDETGPVNLTTALTASKRHMVVATVLDGLWYATAYVAP